MKITKGDASVDFDSRIESTEEAMKLLDKLNGVQETSQGVEQEKKVVVDTATVDRAKASGKTKKRGRRKECVQLPWTGEEIADMANMIIDNVPTSVIVNHPAFKRHSGNGKSVIAKYYVLVRNNGRLVGVNHTKLLRDLGIWDKLVEKQQEYKERQESNINSAVKVD